MMRTRSHLHIFVRGTCPQGASPTPQQERQAARVIKTPATLQTPGTTRARRVRTVATSPLQKRPRTAGLEGGAQGAADGAMDTPTARTRKPQPPIKGLFTRTRGSGGGRGRSEAGRPAGAVKVLHKDLGKVVDHLLEIGVRVCVCACVRVCVCVVCLPACLSVLCLSVGEGVSRGPDRPLWKGRDGGKGDARGLPGALSSLWFLLPSQV